MIDLAIAYLDIPATVFSATHIRNFYLRWCVDNDVLGTVTIEKTGLLTRMVRVVVSLTGDSPDVVVAKVQDFVKVWGRYEELMRA